MKSTPKRNDKTTHSCTVTDATGRSYPAKVVAPDVVVVKIDKLDLPVQVALADGAAATVTDVEGPVSHPLHTHGENVFAVRVAEIVEDDSAQMRRMPWICVVVPRFCS